MNHMNILRNSIDNLCCCCFVKFFTYRIHTLNHHCWLHPLRIKRLIKMLKPNCAKIPANYWKIKKHSQRSMIIDQILSISCDMSNVRFHIDIPLRDRNHFTDYQYMKRSSVCLFLAIWRMQTKREPNTKCLTSVIGGCASKCYRKHSNGTN